MSMTPDDPRLTAYALGELTGPDRAAVEAQLASSEALRRTVAEIRTTGDAVQVGLLAEPCPMLLDSQRAAVTKAIDAVAAGNAAAAASAGSAAGASFISGSLGVWLIVGAAALIAGGLGYAAYSTFSGDPPEEATADSTASGETDDTPVSAKSGTSTGVSSQKKAPAKKPRAAASPTIITLRVGDVMPIRVMGSTGSGRQLQLRPDLLTWEKQPLAQYADFRRDTCELVGRKPTDRPQKLVVRFGDITAEAYINIIAAPGEEKKMEEFLPHPPIRESESN